MMCGCAGRGVSGVEAEEDWALGRTEVLLGVFGVIPSLEQGGKHIRVLVKRLHSYSATHKDPKAERGFGAGVAKAALC